MTLEEKIRNLFDQWELEGIFVHAELLDDVLELLRQEGVIS